MAERKAWESEQDKFITQKVRYNQKVPQKDRLKWGDIAIELNTLFTQSNRTGKQCRQRWHNQLDPAISHIEWSLQQQKKMFQLQKKLGNKWAQISIRLSGRTDNNVKNYFYSTLRKSLRKVNAFILANRHQLKNAKQFKQSSLSKLLAVADHKFDKKINIKKVTAQDQAVQIKNLLIELTHVEIDDAKSKKTFSALIEKLQDFNKNCKKKKSKKKQINEARKVQESENEGGDQQNDQHQEQEQQNNVQEQKLSQAQVLNKKYQNRSRSRNTTKTSQIRKQISNFSQKSKRSSKKSSIKSSKKQKKPKQKLLQMKNQLKTLAKRNSIPLEAMKRQSSSSSKLNPIMKLQSSRSYGQFNRSSLDLGSYQQRYSSNSLQDSSNLFKSFNIKQTSNEQQQSKKKTTTNRVLRKQSNMNYFMDTIRQEKLNKNQSSQLDKRFSQISDLMWKQQQMEFGPNTIKDNLQNSFLRRQSSFHEFPPLDLRQSSYSSNAFLDSNNSRFQPQFFKLRSFSKKQSFGGQYDFKRSQAPEL